MPENHMPLGMPLVDHLFVSDGALYDTRVVDWHKKQPLRPVFNRGFPEIRNTHEYRAALRYGQFTQLGGYQMYLLCSDGAPLCFKCGRKELRNILPAIQNEDRGGWRVVAADINYEDNELYCAHCNDKIPAAYGGDD